MDSTRRIKSKNILVRFPPDCGFKYPVPPVKIPSDWEWLKCWFFGIRCFYDRGQSRFGV